MTNLEELHTLAVQACKPYLTPAGQIPEKAVQQVAIMVWMALREHIHPTIVMCILPDPYEKVADYAARAVAEYIVVTEVL